MSAPGEALVELAARLRADDSVISPYVADSAPGVEPVLGLLAAAGPRAAGSPGEYALVVESVREGYLLHYEEPRILAGTDDDLALLAGDYLYALGLERLAALGDLAAIRELSDLISLAAQLHGGDREPGVGERVTNALWLASVVAVAVGSNPAHEQGKSALRGGRTGAARWLWREGLENARKGGVAELLERAAEALGFQPD